MIQIKSFDLQNQSLRHDDAKAIADFLHAGEVIDLALMSPQVAKQLLEEFVRVLDLHVDSTVRSYKQILVGQNRCVLNWGTAAEDHAVFLDLEPYPLLGRLFHNIVAISNHLRSPGENLLLSVIPSLRRTNSSPRFYHRESHRSLDQLQVEGKSPSIYRLTCDLGLENTFEILNVNLVPRGLLLKRDGRIKRRYFHLFQQRYIDFSDQEDIGVVQRQITEDMLPFPQTRHDLLPGRALIWLDDLFYHTPYLRKGRSESELRSKPRSIVIVNEFRGNSYRSIDWSPTVRRLLDDLVGW